MCSKTVDHVKDMEGTEQLQGRTDQKCVCRRVPDLPTIEIDAGEVNHHVSCVLMLWVEELHHDQVRFGQVAKHLQPGSRLWNFDFVCSHALMMRNHVFGKSAHTLESNP